MKIRGLCKFPDSLGKVLMLGKIRLEEKQMREDEVIGWHHWLSGPEFEQILGDGEGQGSPMCCSPCDCRELRHDLVTEQ